jgi:hypothetical protein
MTTDYILIFLACLAGWGLVSWGAAFTVTKFFEKQDAKNRKAERGESK